MYILRSCSMTIVAVALKVPSTAVTMVSIFLDMTLTVLAISIWLIFKSSIACPTPCSCFKSSWLDVFKPKRVPIVFPPHEKGASPVIDDETAFTAAVVPRPIPNAAKGPNGALLVRMCAVVGGWVGTVVVVGVVVE